MKSYYRIMLGRGSLYAKECVEDSFVGADFNVHHDLTDQLTDNWRDFNHAWIPKLIDESPGMTRIAGGLACGALHTVAKGINGGDIVISPNGQGSYLVGEVVGKFGRVI